MSQVLHNRILRHDGLDKRYQPQVNQYLGKDGMWGRTFPAEYHIAYKHYLVRVEARTDYSYMGHADTGEEEEEEEEETVQAVSAKQTSARLFRERQVHLFVHYTVARANGQVRWLPSFLKPTAE
jgi:hypothetical protein